MKFDQEENQVTHLTKNGRVCSIIKRKSRAEWITSSIIFLLFAIPLLIV